MSHRKTSLVALLFFLLLPPVVRADSVTFDYQPFGTDYGASSGHVPGDFIFHEFGADVYVDQFFTGGVPYFNAAIITSPFTSPIFFGAGQIMQTSNTDLVLQFSAPGDVTCNYLDLGGSVNLQVNGHAMVIESPDFFPLAGPVAPGVTLTVTTIPVPGGHKGVC